MIPALPESEILALYVEAGLGYRTVADRLGLSYAHVGRFLNERGLMRPRPRAPAGLTLPPGMHGKVRHALRLAYLTVEQVGPPDLPEADRDDFDQVARYAALKALATYDPTAGAHWRTWVISKVRWAVQEELRQLAVYSRRERDRRRAETGEEGGEPRQRPVSLEALLESAPEGGWVWENPYRWDEESWLTGEALRQGIAALPEREQAVIRARLADRTTAEIAAAFGVCTSTIHNWERAAREKLGVLLGEGE